MCLIFVGQGYPRKLFNLEHFPNYGIYAVHYGLIFIYDSMAPVISHTVQMQAAAILQSLRSDIVFEAQRMIPQEGVSDCGLFAIAYATDLCIGNNPAAYRYRCNIS